MRNLRLLVLALVAAVAAGALALDAPHDASFSLSVTGCWECHQLHSSAGGTLTQYPTNNDACLTCHKSTPASPNHLFADDWTAGVEAIPGTSGTQHKWSGSPTARGASIPTDPAMAAYLTGATPQLQCAVCHDTHGVKDAFGTPIQETYAPESAFASYPIGVAQPPVGGGDWRLKIVTINDWGIPPIPQGYAIRIKSPGVLQVSHNYNGATPEWSQDIGFTVGDTDAENVWLDDPSVVVRITAFPDPPTVGDLWQFYVGYPLLRASNVNDAMCMDCHADRVMDHTTVEGGNGAFPADGSNYFSHPVGQVLNANGKGYDAAAPLDADGTATTYDPITLQPIGSLTDGSGDVPNPSNDLRTLGGEGGIVGCTSCHAPHNTDSNSLTVDVR